MSKIVQRLPFYDYQEGLSWIWQELEDLISYLPNLLYIHILNIYLGFEFGPQRIRDLAFVCP